ncbi:MAG: LysM peptidoglycan-binding domain-containing protein [Kiritimatiellae bacterium]|nr:LysM peptidoglycan-binding domain-containing protein [Kiritimatiellia bacterium]
MKSCLVLVVLAGVLVSGCESMMFDGSPYQRQPSRQSLEISRMQSTQDQLTASIQRLSGQFDELERSNQQLEKRLSRLESRLSSVAESKASAYESDMAALRRDIQAARQETQQMRKQVANDLAARIEQIAKQDEAARKAAATKATKAATTAAASAAARGSGYEHTVQKGQTLLEIARGYGVPMATIMKANNIKNASNIRVGQVLFIPDAK